MLVLRYVFFVSLSLLCYCQDPTEDSSTTQDAVPTTAPEPSSDADTTDDITFDSTNSSENGNNTSKCNDGVIKPGRDCLLYCVIEKTYNESDVESISKIEYNVGVQKEGESCTITRFRWGPPRRILPWTNSWFPFRNGFPRFMPTIIDGTCDGQGRCIPSGRQDSNSEGSGEDSGESNNTDEDDFTNSNEDTDYDITE